jgi:hypothetical protein
MSAFHWIPRKKKGRKVIHGDVLRILQTKAPLPSMPRMAPAMAHALVPTATPNEACYIVGSACLRSRLEASPEVRARMHFDSPSFRVTELAFALGAYRLALRDEELTEDSVYQEARKVMPELVLQAEELERGA